jgi:hypothetical protein
MWASKPQKPRVLHRGKGQPNVCLTKIYSYYVGGLLLLAKMKTNHNTKKVFQKTVKHRRDNFKNILEAAGR